VQFSVTYTFLCVWFRHSEAEQINLLFLPLFRLEKTPVLLT